MSRRTVFLESRGYITVVFSGNLFTLTEADRILLSAITDAIEKYKSRVPELQSSLPPKERT